MAFACRDVKSTVLSQLILKKVKCFHSETAWATQRTPDQTFSYTESVGALTFIVWPPVNCLSSLSPSFFNGKKKKKQ